MKPIDQESYRQGWVDCCNRMRAVIKSNYASDFRKVSYREAAETWVAVMNNTMTEEVGTDAGGKK
jgi:cell fate regulator YaaT (PSP1 superfamily)